MNIDINNPKDVFYSFLTGSRISYVGAGTSGLGLQLLNTENTSYKTLTTDNKNVVCSKLFLKLVPIYNETYDMTFDVVVPGVSIITIISSLETNFWREVHNQVIIYKETCDNLEPICPPIVYTECQNNVTSIRFIESLITRHVDKIDDDEDDDPLIVLSSKFKKHTKLRLGVIAMGFTIDYIPLYKAIRADPSKRDFYMELAIYELIRLYAYGYLHGDFSLANIMINPTYNYTGTDIGRAMLIDFGMTHEHTYTDTNIVSILNNMLNTRVPLNNVLPIEHNNYKWLQKYIEKHGENIENTINELSRQVTNHNMLMINMVQDTYPDILLQIRSYVNTPINSNIFSGGFMLTEQNIPSEISIQNNPKIDMKPKNSISVDKFNSIFNPNNLDILKLKDDYLHTLMLGYTSIKHGKKQMGISTGGKKRKKRKSTLLRTRKSKSKKRIRKSKTSKRTRK